MENNGVLLISCSDCKGIVADVSQFLYQHGANIIHADQHKDSELNLFFMRVEWSLDDFDLTRQEFSQCFETIAAKYKMEWRFALTLSRLKTAILVSQQDHCLVDLLYRHHKKELNSDIKLVISNYKEAEKLTAFYHIPYYKIQIDKKNKAVAEKRILALLQKYGIDFVILTRYMQILSPEFVKQYPNKIINIHHSFLPAFIGAKPYHQAYDRGVKIIGATSHYVTEGLDSGPIIEQDVIRITHRDSVNDLISKGRDLERIVLSRAVRWHTENRILIYANKTVVFS